MKLGGGLSCLEQLYLAVELGGNEYRLKNSVGGRQMEHDDA